MVFQIEVIFSSAFFFDKIKEADISLEAPKPFARQNKIGRNDPEERNPKKK
ncbi:hypothetical protein [Salipaludibacillus sp. CF4.18]|uniref:hypothetical protein n=1 Tax=Salipaludibacillus sp. CF4.18 TaxID=3373081 RepID=UPI003EE6B70F